MTMPERIWAMPVTDDGKAGSYCDAGNMPLAPSNLAFCYRRADLPPTIAQALALPEIAALVDAAHRVNHDNLHGNGLEGFRYGRERLWRALGAIDDAIAKVQP